MTTATTTTISGVSLLTRQGERAPEPFEIALSVVGIDFRRAERPGARLSWDRVSAWEVEERTEGEVVLTLLGDGAETPLVIPGWTVADLDALLRQLTREEPAAAATTEAPPAATAPATTRKTEPDDAGRPGVVELLGTLPEPESAAGVEDGQAETGRPQRGQGVPWKAVVTIALLGVVATAITLVLLQSAGVISWGFLGPTS